VDSDRDYYAMLGLTSTAEVEVIQAVYRALAKKYHPDVYKGDKIAFVGQNGCGKTTLTKIINSELNCKGNIKIGDKVIINYFDQNQNDLFDLNMSILEYIENIFEKEMLINGEAYISTPYEEMIKAGLKVNFFKIDYFFQWGTPEDYNEFLYNLDEVHNVRNEKKIDLTGINLLIPAGGEGQRFKKENYKTEKIFLDVSGEPLIKNITSSFKNQESTAILVTKNNQGPLNALNLVSSKSLITISEKTKDQAHSGMKLVDEVENDFPILIHSADCILDKNIELDITDYDVGIITKKNYRRAFFKFDNYGWVNNIENKITTFSIKKKPYSKKSNVITGIFIFKDKNTYKTLFEDTIKRLNNSNSEIHIDYLIETAVLQNMRIKEIATSKTVMIGTPLEYELYKYMDYVSNYLDQD